jgi:hypothetical protein
MWPGVCARVLAPPGRGANECFWWIDHVHLAQAEWGRNPMSVASLCCTRTHTDTYRLVTLESQIGLDKTGWMAVFVPFRKFAYKRRRSR